MVSDNLLLIIQNEHTYFTKDDVPKNNHLRLWDFYFCEELYFPANYIKATVSVNNKQIAVRVFYKSKFHFKKSQYYWFLKCRETFPTNIPLYFDCFSASDGQVNFNNRNLISDRSLLLITK